MPAQLRLLAAVADQAPAPLWVIDDGGRVEFANVAALRLLGYDDPREVVGRPSHETLHHRRPDGSDYPPESCPLLSDQPAENPVAKREWFLRRTGEPVPVVWRTAALDAGNGSRILAFDAVPAGSSTAVRPVSAGGLRTTGKTADDVRERLLDHVDRRFRDPQFRPSVLAAENRLSLRTIQSVLAQDGSSPAALIRHRRLQHAADLLSTGEAVASACFASGFSDLRTFTRAFSRRFGVTPAARRHHGADPATVDTTSHRLPAAASRRPAPPRGPGPVGR